MITDIIIILLLIATCGYCLYLSTRLDALRSSNSELHDAIATFDQASRIAQENIKKMETMSNRSDVDVKKTMSKSEALIGELSIMVSAGERIAARIDQAMTDVRAIQGKRATEKASRTA